VAGAEMQFFVRTNGAANTLQTMSFYHDGGIAMHNIFARAYTFANFPRPLLMDNVGYLTAPNLWGLSITHSQSRPVSMNPDGTLGFFNVYGRTTGIGLSPSTWRPVMTDSGGAFSTENIYQHTVGATWRPVYVDNNGNVGGMTPPSSRRFKHKIEDVAVAVAQRFLDGLRPVTFVYKDDTEQTSRMGLIAEEVEATGYIEAVIYDNDGQVHGVAYERLIVPMISMIQELKRQVEQLRAEMQELRGEI
jgi:hypothetical protein